MIIHGKNRIGITTHYRWLDDIQVGSDPESLLFRTDAVRYPEDPELYDMSLGGFLLDPYSNKALIIDGEMAYVKLIGTKMSLRGGFC